MVVQLFKHISGIVTSFSEDLESIDLVFSGICTYLPSTHECSKDIPEITLGGIQTHDVPTVRQVLSLLYCFAKLSTLCIAYDWEKVS